MALISKSTYADDLDVLLRGLHMTLNRRETGFELVYHDILGLLVHMAWKVQHHHSRTTLLPQFAYLSSEFSSLARSCSFSRAEISSALHSLW